MNSELYDNIRLHISEILAQRRHILIVAWCVFLIGVPITYMLPDRYRSVGILSVDAGVLSQIFGAGILNKTASDQAESVRARMVARPNLEKIIESADLDIALKTPVAKESFINHILDNLKIIPDVRDNYTVTYIHKNPETAQKIVQQTMNVFIEKNIKTINASTDDKRLSIQKNIDVATKELTIAQEALAAFKAKYSISAQSENSTNNELVILQNTINNIPTELRGIESRIEKTTTLLRTTPVKTSTPAAQERIDPCGTNDLKRKLAEMNVRGLTENHPDIINTKNLIIELERTCKIPSNSLMQQDNPLHVQLTDQLNSLKIERDQLLSKSITLEQQRSELKAKMGLQPSLIEEMKNLERAADAVAQKLTSYKNELNSVESLLEADKRTSVVKYRIEQAASMPLQAEFPNRLLLFAGVAAASLVAGLGYAIVCLQMTGRLPTLHHVKQAFDLPVLGTFSQHSERMPWWKDKVFAIGIILLLIAPILVVKIAHPILRVFFFSLT